MLKRVALALLAAAAFGVWIGALPALVARTGLSWRAAPCAAPAYRDPVTGRATSLSGGAIATACLQAQGRTTR